MSIETLNKEKINIPPYKVGQALVALALDDTDKSLLEFYKVFQNNIPVYASKFLHVVPVFNLYNALYRRHPSALEAATFNEKILEEMEEEIKSLIGGDPSRFELEIKEGNPLNQVLENAIKLESELVVIGQRTGYWGSHGILAKRLARKIDNDFLVIPDETVPVINQIIVPIDFSDYSKRALQAALSINASMKTPVPIICLHCYTMPDKRFYNTTHDDHEIRAMMEESSNYIFEDFLRPFGKKVHYDVNIVNLEVNQSSIVKEIVDYAEAQEGSFIVMGAKGHSRLESLVLGSVSEGIISVTKSTPVMVVK